MSQLCNRYSVVVFIESPYSTEVDTVRIDGIHSHFPLEENHRRSEEILIGELKCHGIYQCDIRSGQNTELVDWAVTSSELVEIGSDEPYWLA